MRRVQRMTTTTAAVLSALYLLINNLVSVEGWRKSRTFLVTPSTVLSKQNSLLLHVRGGSSSLDDDISSSSVDNNAENEAAPIEVVEADTAGNEVADASIVDEQHPRNLTFPATNPHDGSSSDPDGIPSRFLQMKKDNRAEAKEAWDVHLEWRKEFQVDTLLSRPHKLYDVCKAMVPHYFSGRDPHGNVIFVQRPAMLDFELMRRNNATMDDLLLHYVYVIEYCWNILDPSPPEKVMTNVLDMKGLRFRNMKNTEYITFGKQFVSMMSSNYPGRSFKTLVVNAPSWFHALYKIFKPILRESTRRKIVILKAGEKQDSALKFYLGDSVPKDLLSGSEGDESETGTIKGRYFIPVDDVSQCGPGPNSEIEFHMRQFCIEQLKVHNETLQDVV